MTQTSPEAETTNSAESPGIEASVWRLFPGGTLISSVVEKHAAASAEMSPEVIFFYAELGNSARLTNTAKTIDKVFGALAAVGLSESQILKAINKMQADGIYFREEVL